MNKHLLKLGKVKFNKVINNFLILEDIILLAQEIKINQLL